MLIRLPTGQRVLIRQIRPSDKSLLKAGLARLSAETIRRRFLSPKPTLSSGELRYLTEIDGENHVAYVALLADVPRETLIAVGRYVATAEDPRTAEVAVVVGDEFQGHGLGTRLGLALADHARTVGIQRFSASMLSDNAPAHRLFARISQRLSSERQTGVDTLIADLAA
ncbi:MAG TPA: GNAT family N-acetyltransferase [Solirubrobacteraceae bacterium]|nr:GNAT family N-acetyltransferase [Solirubrobacteraceae bacterium]